MNVPSARMLVMTGQKFACIRIIGRANFNSSVDFKTLVSDLRQKGVTYFVLDLSECVLMDSTFLGELAGFGLKMLPPSSEPNGRAIELVGANPRIAELLENLGVIHLFKLSQGPLSAPNGAEARPCEQLKASREEVTRACLEAHQTLMAINPDNAIRFKDVTQFLAENLRKLKSSA